MLGFTKHRILLFLHDLVQLNLAIFFAYLLGSNFLPFKHNYSNYFCEIGITVITLIVILFHGNFYKYQHVLNRAKHVVLLLRILSISLFITIILAFFFKIKDVTDSRFYIGMVYTFLFLYLFISRVILVPWMYRTMVRMQYIKRNLLIVGVGDLAREKVKYLLENQHNYYTIVGYLRQEKSGVKNGDTIEGVEVLGSIKDLVPVVRKHVVHDILICLEGMSNHKMQCTIDFCKRTGRTTHVVSELYNIITEKIDVDEISGISSFRVKRSTYNIYELIRRIYDIGISLFFILTFLPFWLIIIFLIKITSKGPLFYRPKMVGLNEQFFMMYKFRSMYANNDASIHQDLVTEMIKENKTTEKIKNDPRITPIGRILRKLSLDEFPQLLNVIKGNMSLVGPRPCTPYEFEAMDKWHKKRFLVKPGITGLWQIKGRNEVKFNDQIALDLYYIENRSVKLDFEILFKTVPVVVFGKGGK